MQFYFKGNPKKSTILGHLLAFGVVKNNQKTLRVAEQTGSD